LTTTHSLTGLAADITKNKLHRPRTYCVTFVAFLFIVSQIVLVIVDDVHNLWMSSALLGLAYGSLFGVFPTVCIEWFGLGKLQLAYSMLMLFSAVFMV
jgi:MFS family permease